MGWRRRFCPRPVIIAAIVAVCVFYQCLTQLWKNTSWTIMEYTGDRQKEPRDLAAEDCLHQWGDMVRMFKDNADQFGIKQLPSPKRRVLLYVHPPYREGEPTLYKKILTRLGHTVLQIEDLDNLNKVVNQNLQLKSKDVLIYIPSTKITDETCEAKSKLAKISKLTKVNLLSGMQQLLCNRSVCEMAAHFPEMANLSICASQNSNHLKSRHIRPYLGALLNVPSPHHTPSSDSPLVRTFVLMTSLSPLRAYIHPIAMVQDQPDKPFFKMKLQNFYGRFFKPPSSLEAFNALKEMISKLLLTLEVMSAAADTGPDSLSRCNKCFQLLTFDIGYSRASPPSVQEVKGSYNLHNVHAKDRDTMEAILHDVLKFILQVSSSSFLKVMTHIQRYPSKKENICRKERSLDWTWENIDDLYTFLQELTHLRAFELIYPSTSVTLKCFRSDLYHRASQVKQIGSWLTKHDLLIAMLEYMQISKNLILTKSENSEDKDHALSTSSVGHKTLSEHKMVNCSNDNDTLSYISRFFSNPPLDLTPEFSPKIKEYYAELPFDVVTVEIGAEPAHCQSQVHLDDRDGPSSTNYPLGLGPNLISLHVTDKTKPSPVLLRTYRITVHREERPSMPSFDHHQMCGFLQDCGLVINEKEPCGLQSLSNETLLNMAHARQIHCQSGDAQGQWVVPCLTCTDNRTCDWRSISWQPHHCHHPTLQRHELQHCLKDRKILFIGDSTNRGMMYYLIERANGTLEKWEKTHDVKLFENINDGQTNITYSYYPQFWIDIKQRLTFEEALENLLERSHPLKNTHQTVLVVGGVQWLNPDHLHIIQSVLKRRNLRNILVIIKSIGMGFHLPVPGIRSLSHMQIRQLSKENDLILKTAKRYGYEVVDTFSITMGRHKEFLRGKCACHYHEVVKTNSRDRTNLLTLGRKNLYQVPDKQLDLVSPYHVQGPINQVYSEILLNRICTKI